MVPSASSLASTGRRSFGHPLPGKSRMEICSLRDGSREGLLFAFPHQHRIGLGRAGRKASMEIRFFLFNPLGSSRLISGKHSYSPSLRKACRTARGAAEGALQVSTFVKAPLTSPCYAQRGGDAQDEPLSATAPFVGLQTASRCQLAPSLLFPQNKGRETCSGDLFTSQTISSYIMTQAWLPANCCSEPGKTIRSSLRAVSAHNAGFVPPCHQPQHVQASPAHPSSSEEEMVEGKEKPLAVEREHLGGGTRAGVGMATQGQGAPGMEPVCKRFPVLTAKG